MRPMWLEFPKNEEAFKITSQFMFGDSLLFAPKLNEHDQDVDVYLPQEATWYQFNSTEDVTPEAIVSDDSGRWWFQKLWDKTTKKAHPEDIV